MSLVVDASAIVGQVLDDEAAAFAEATIAAVRHRHAFVPSIFWFELRNVLVIAECRKRLTDERSAAFLARIGKLLIEIESVPPEFAVLDLAWRHALSVYDAAYVELAVRTASTLATLDRPLC